MNSKVSSASILAKEAFKDLKQFQIGEKKLVKTRRDYIDCHIGGLKPSDLVLIGAKSGVGKTYELMKILKGILDSEINPLATNFVSLEFTLEMKFLDLILRDTHGITNKSKKDILTQEFTEEEKKLVEEYYNSLKDGRRFIVQETVTAKEWFDICDEFCKDNADKSAIIISIDHLVLILGEGNSNPLVDVSTYTNILRKRYANVYFIYLTQFNRTGEIKEKSNIMIPKASEVYGSSHFEFLSAYIVALSNPFKSGIEEYMKVKKDRYPELEEFLTAPNEKGFCSFKTLGNMFIHVIKIRESDNPYMNLTIEKMKISEEQLEKMKMDVDKEDNFAIEGFEDIPNFNTNGEVPF